MGDTEIEDYGRLRKKYQKLYSGSEVGLKEEEGYYPKLRRYGGLFTAPMRRGLLNVERRAGRDRKNINFWYDVRRTIKTGLIDLQLFIDTADEKNLKKVLTPEALEPIIESLLLRPIHEKAEPDLTRANIAKLFIHVGFEYLTRMQKIQTVEFLNKAIKNAYVASKHLVELLRAHIGSTETRYVSPVERWERPKP